jgi:uncharacterized repeat protein (TIGR03803 family)
MRVTLALALPLFIGHRAQTAELQTIFNFGASLGSVAGNLVQGPDGNFYGTSRIGGPAGNGTIFRVTPAGVLTIVSANLLNPSAGLVVGNDGLLYGLTESDTGLGFGTVFKVTTTGVLSTVATFDGVNAAHPVSGLTLAPDGNFYGTSPQGGTNGTGAVFRVTPGGLVTLLVSFDGTSLGGAPSPGLTVGPDGNLYGMTSFGGAAGSGTIFKVTLGGTLTTLHSFSGADGVFRQPRLTLGPDGNLYGTLRDGGALNAGEIFKITTTGVFTALVSFNGPPNGAFPFGELTTGADRQLYGTTSSGGTVNLGTVFKMTTNGVLTTLFSFTNEANGQPQAGLLLAADGNFYGCSQGSVYKMTPAGVVTTLVSLSPPDGLSPRTGLTLGPDAKLYGTASEGGANNAGTIFSLTTSGVLTTLASFNVTNGQAPAAALTLGKDGNFYGTASLGGPNLAGTVFRFSTNGALTALASFSAVTGSHPQGQLAAASDGSFFGTTPDQGPGGFGTVFRVTTNGTLTRLVSFNIGNGATPEDGLVLAMDGNFYGTTAVGGINDLGTVFRVSPAGALATLSLNAASGSSPLGGLVQGPDGTLYGTTAFGGPTNAGTIFKLNTNGTLTTIFQFHFTDGSEPASKLVFGPDGNLYGTTLFGGSTGSDPFGPGLGTVFRITTNGVFTPLVLFQGTNGANPVAPVAFGSDGNLYGTTSEGGPGNGGTLFRVVLEETLTNTPPTVAITSPTDGSSFIAPATITIQADASDSDGSVTNVQFFDGTTSLGNVSSSPFDLSVSLEAGVHRLTVVAFDDLGASTASLVTVTVTTNSPPTVTITTPINGASFIAPATITIQADASDSDGSITNVQFFDGETFLGSVASSPFNFSVSLAVGSHALFAIASDNLGATTTTLPVTVIGLTETVISGVTNLPDGTFQFAFTNTPGASFTVLTSTNITLPLDEWTSAGAALETSPGSYQFTDETTSSPQRFYRIRSP